MNKIFLRITMVAVLLHAIIHVSGQTSFEPQNLGENVNSEYAEINPVLSRDGSTLFFSRANHPSNRFGDSDSQDIWFSSLQTDGTWGVAERLPNTVNIGQHNAILSALGDGQSYLLLGRFNRRGTLWVTRGFSIIKKLDNGSWSVPEPVKVKRFKRINKGKTVSAYMTPDREYIFITFSAHPNSQRLSLYVSKRKKDNVYLPPKAVHGGKGNAMNPRTIESPYLTADKSRLYFSGDYSRGRGGNNIYYADNPAPDFREWGAPQIVTDTINTPNWDSHFTMNATESWGYYASTTNSFGKSDIFRVKFFEENPYLKLSGLVLNQADQTLMIEDTTYSVLVNGEDFEGFSLDKTSASYEALLPLGDYYTIQPAMEKWNGISFDIDLRNVREYTESKQNIYFSSIPFVQVKGKIVDTHTNEVLSGSYGATIEINGLPSDSIVYDKFSSAFQALLPLGSKYAFSASVNNFTSSVEVVDVSTQTQYVEKDILVKVTPHPWVLIKGKVLDNNSLTPVTAQSNPTLIINGQEVDTVLIDPVTADFELRLPYGQNHVVGVKAENYRTIDNQIDLTSYTRFAEVPQNLFAERADANMVTLNGKVINTKTGKMLEEGYHVTMRVNGVETPAFVYDSKNATYTLKLPVGFNYDLTPNVYNFYNKFEPVDLTEATPMTKIVRNFYVTPIEVGQSIDIEHIYFETGRNELKPQSYRSLAALVQFLNEYPNVRVEIGGHTDNTGSVSVNKRLSEARARAVAEYGIQQGLPPERIVSKGYWFTKPKASNRTAEGRAKNRRVDFTIVGI
ncbi:MAG: OmpA family protein [Tenuifilaceae bacterium]|nr:OmpA family protein [Tenuifilaceae bacterium]